jgi:hypothetical protein
MPAIAQAKIELRSSIGDGALPAADEKPLSPTSQRRTADASRGPPISKPPVMMSDATPEVAKAEPAANNLKTPSSRADAEKPAARRESGKELSSPADAGAARKIDAAFLLKRTGQIAVFISRKDSKLYVRQNFSPLFDMPVTIAPDERPLGTHIFTAQVDKDDANVLHWSSVSLPAPSRHAERRGRDEPRSHRRNAVSAVPIEPQQLPMSDGPAEALDRLSLPADIMARIYETLSTGGSIIVSDQGIAAGETGEGTDFIVSLR